MNTIPELLPISELRLHQNDVLERLKSGPVVLTQHSRAAAVSVEQWNMREERLRNAELLAVHYRRLAEMQSDPSARISFDELKKKLDERRGIRPDETEELQQTTD